MSSEAERVLTGDLGALKAFLVREFPHGMLNTPPDEPIVNTAMVLLKEMKDVLVSHGFQPEGGKW